jgi:hypothetical protein
MGIDRLWGIPGGFLDLVAILIQTEAGCWGVVVFLAEAMRYEIVADWLLAPSWSGWNDPV